MAQQQEPIRNFILHDRHGKEIDFSSFAVVGEVEVNLGENIGTAENPPEASSSYEGGKLTINLDRLKANGISSIEFEASQDDSGANILRIVPEEGEPYEFEVLNGSRGNGIESFVEVGTHTDADDGLNTYRATTTDGGVVDIVVKNGSKGNRGNGITSIVTQEIQEDGGENIVTVKTTDNPAGQSFSVRNGRRGPQGDSVLVGQGDLPLAHVLGQDNTKAMSQKGVTDELTVITKTITNEQIEEIGDTRYIYNDTWYNTSTGNNGRLVNISQYRGNIISIVSNENYGARIAFFSTDPVNNQEVPYCEDAPALISGLQPGEVYSTIVPTDCKFLYLRHEVNGNNYTPSSVNFFKTIKEKVSDLETELNTLDAKADVVASHVDEINNVVTDNVKVPIGTITGEQIAALTQTRYIYNGVWYNTSTGNYGRLVDISAYRGKTISVVSNENYGARIAFFSTDPVNNQPVPYCEDAPALVSGLQPGEVYSTIVPSDCKYLYVRHSISGNVYTPAAVNFYGTIKERIPALEANLNTIAAKVDVMTYHVDEINGSDSNDGMTSSSAFATVAKALSMSGKNVSLVLHGIFTTPIRITEKNSVIIMGDNAQINYGTKISTATLVSGYEDVYEKDITLPSGYVENGTNYGIWLWQSGVTDTRTEIAQHEKHPCQRNLSYRLSSTKITKVGSISEVASSEELTYYYDSTSNKVYFKIAPETTLESNPVMIRKEDNDYAIYIQCNELLMSNVQALYAGVMLKAAKAELTDCRCLYGTNGFRFTETNNSKPYETVVMIRCEAAGCFSLSGNGDGFGSSVGRSTLIDCWAHDNYDDGYSEHSGSKSTIIGGLFEYCGQGGITPSCCVTTIIGATCRHNGIGGILCVKPMSSNAMVANAKNCVCYDNEYNYYIEGIGSALILEGCQSLNAIGFGYYNKDGAARSVLRNCTHFGTGTPRNLTSYSGYFIIENGTIVD